MGPKCFKKISGDKSVGVYMGNRDFVDHIDSVDPVDGVVLVDPKQMKDRKAYITLSCIFKYGPEDADVLGMKFWRVIYERTHQVYPPLQDRERSTHTEMQERLLLKLGNNAYPFFFELPDNLPCSVTLQPALNDPGKHCAVEFEVKAFSAKSPDEKPPKKQSSRMMFRKVQHAPQQSGPAPSLQTSFEFPMSDKCIHLEASLEKLTYYHGERIDVHVNINNETGRTVEGITLLVEQVTTVVLYSNDNYAEVVATEKFPDTVDAGGSLDKVYSILPLLANNRNKRGIALDGKVSYDDTNLASSSIVKEGVLKEVLGMLVSYKVVLKIKTGGALGTSDVKAELPFQLMHPNPDAGRYSWNSKDEEMVEEDKKEEEGAEDGNKDEGETPAEG